eukprot:TRINITY_DN1530_c0_g1_i1.p2 TRINITY_DN1530_c0_g1~~TRINITY_DN1530_c0_g1_i1.p2  ORF type:complete len:154 (+),score=11.25 TRINITY_DN1530_c0_g1_i1:120-581(+)
MNSMNNIYQAKQIMGRYSFTNKNRGQTARPSVKLAVLYRNSKTQGSVTRQRRKLIVKQAKENDKDNVDWDAEWKSYKGTWTEEQKRVLTDIPRTPYVDPRRERIKKQEMLALDIWSKESFFGIAGISVIVVLLCFILVSGGAPSDSRCTLPWC